MSFDKQQDKGIFVKNISEFNNVVSNAKPGNVITLDSGVWTGAELVFEANGTKDNPIKFTIEEKGKVTLKGASNLQIDGEYLIVEGLFF